MDDRKRVLVVDDDPDLVESISMKLESSDFRAIKAFDGAEAWKKIKEEKPDLVILDVMMPGKDGYKVCNEIKKDPKYQDIVVLLLTGVADFVPKTTYTHFDGKATMADDYIAKPIDLSKLMKIVKENLIQK